jgi:hypothetical protein
VLLAFDGWIAMLLSVLGKRASSKIKAENAIDVVIVVERQSMS